MFCLTIRKLIEGTLVTLVQYDILKDGNSINNSEICDRELIRTIL
jgi:hypothetical protein